jgi:hypothetical protein
VTEAAEAIEAEAVAGEGPVTVELAGEPIEVLPVRQWRSSALRALREGDFEDWAERSLTENGHEKWLEVDPTIEEVEAFFEAWGEKSGERVGKSSPSRRSSTRTRKR